MSRKLKVKQKVDRKNTCSSVFETQNGNRNGYHFDTQNGLKNGRVTEVK